MDRMIDREMETRQTEKQEDNKDREAARKRDRKSN